MDIVDEARRRLATPSGRVKDERGFSCSVCKRFLHACNCEEFKTREEPWRAAVAGLLAEVLSLARRVGDVLDERDEARAELAGLLAWADRMGCQPHAWAGARRIVDEMGP